MEIAVHPTRGTGPDPGRDVDLPAAARCRNVDQIVELRESVGHGPGTEREGRTPAVVRTSGCGPIHGIEGAQRRDEFSETLCREEIFREIRAERVRPLAPTVQGPLERIPRRGLAEEHGLGNGEWQAPRKMAEPAMLARRLGARPAHAWEPRDDGLPHPEERIVGAGRGNASNARLREAARRLGEQRAHQSHVDRGHLFIVQSEASRAVPAPSE